MKILGLWTLYPYLYMIAMCLKLSVCLENHSEQFYQVFNLFDPSAVSTDRIGSAQNTDKTPEQIKLRFLSFSRKLRLIFTED